MKQEIPEGGKTKHPHVKVASRAMFHAALHHVRPLAVLLRAVNIQSQGLVVITEEGLRISADESHSVQASAYCKKDMFQEYTLELPDTDTDGFLSFSLDLDVLSKCLNVFGNASGSMAGSFRREELTATQSIKANPTATLAYQGYGHPLELTQLGGCVTECRISTFEPEALPSMTEFFGEAICRVIIKAEWLRDAFNDLDDSSDRIQVDIRPEKPYFRLSTTSSSGSAQMDYTKDSDVLEMFQCEQYVSSSYKYSHVQYCKQVLQAASKVSLRVNAEGFMYMQFMVPVNPTTQNFVDFLLAPIEDD
ncbi:hypothetical protein BZG36_05235 [Bifiguratus adelaidae]|uniref:Cell cycle checkpoint protein RAD1 n=1 Tax=Bifiguratus adelaidae TaxID=1938954 RepID=A0A261XT94_9FUNG|nr:hypothetical protein BZG36_05235 [Bifiguratus adelaidae]